MAFCSKYLSLMQPVLGTFLSLLRKLPHEFKKHRVFKTASYFNFPKIGVWVVEFNELD